MRAQFPIRLPSRHPRCRCHCALPLLVCREALASPTYRIPRNALCVKRFWTDSRRILKTRLDAEKPGSVEPGFELLGSEHHDLSERCVLPTPVLTLQAELLAEL